MSHASQPSAPFPWGRHALGQEAEYTLDVGPLRLSFRLDGDEIWISWRSSAPGGEPAHEDAPESESVGWQRWATATGSSTLTVRPSFPDRALVVAPEVPFHVAPGANARIYVRVPLFAAVALADENETLLLEVPTVVLSNTWWGRVVDGELAFWLPTAARRSIGPDDFPHHLAVCPVLIQNRASESLEVDKVAIRGSHLSVFSDGSRLWGDQTAVVYRADEDGSDIDMSGTAPEEADGAVLMTPAREPLTRGLRARTFARIKSLSGF